MRASRVPRIIRTRSDCGSDFGVDLIVVAKKGTKELCWWPGHTTWMSIMEPRGYFPSHLMLCEIRTEVNPGSIGSHREIHEGGRLSRALFFVASRDVRKAVNEFFGPEAADLIAANLKRGTTVVLG